MADQSIKEMKRNIATENPFLLADDIQIKTKKKIIKAGTSSDRLVDISTGEVKGFSVIQTFEYKDDAQFVKIFAEGVKAAFELGTTANRVFQAILHAYENEKMTGGYADCVRLFWFNDGLNGKDIGMSDRTFNRGLKELLEKKFLWPRSHELYWVNPALFFKGDRVAFVKEYRRKNNAIEDKQTS